MIDKPFIKPKITRINQCGSLYLFVSKLKLYVDQDFFFSLSAATILMWSGFHRAQRIGSFK